MKTPASLLGWGELGETFPGGRRGGCGSGTGARMRHAELGGSLAEGLRMSSHEGMGARQQFCGHRGPLVPLRGLDSETPSLRVPSLILPLIQAWLLHSQAPRVLSFQINRPFPRFALCPPRAGHSAGPQMGRLPHRTPPPVLTPGSQQMYLRPGNQKKVGLGFELGRGRFQSHAFTSSLLLLPQVQAHLFPLPPATRELEARPKWPQKPSDGLLDLQPTHPLLSAQHPPPSHPHPGLAPLVLSSCSFLSLPPTAVNKPHQAGSTGRRSPICRHRHQDGPADPRGAGACACRAASPMGRHLTGYLVSDAGSESCIGPLHRSGLQHSFLFCDVCHRS